MKFFVLNTNLFYILNILRNLFMNSVTRLVNFKLNITCSVFLPKNACKFNRHSLKRFFLEKVLFSFKSITQIACNETIKNGEMNIFHCII